MSEISKQKITTYIKALEGAKNYELWALRLDSLLAREGLIDYISIRDYNLYYPVEGEAGITPPDGVKATSIIKLNLADGPLLQMRYITKPFELWEGLKDLYGSKGFNSEFMICKELFDTTLGTSQNRMEVYLNTIKRLTDELKSKDISIPDKLIFAWVLNNLGPQYDTLVTTITQGIRVNADKALKLEDLFSNLIDESKRVKYHQGKDKEVALMAKTDGNKITKKGKKCRHCKKPGHEIGACWKKFPNLRPDKGNKGKDSKDTGKASTSSDEEALIAYQTPERDLDVASDNGDFFAYVTSPMNNKTFLLDSGATTHIISNKDLFKSLNPTTTSISWGKISKIRASGIGDVPITFKDTGLKVTLRNCLYVPELDINLISIGKLLANDYKLIFINQACQIYYGNKLITEAYLHKGLFILPVINKFITECAFSTFQISRHFDENNVMLWHQRMGHINNKALNKLNVIKNPSDFNYKCEECILAKAKRNPNHAISESIPPRNYLELIQSDLFGPTQVASFSNKRYFITFLDKATKWLVARPLNYKNDTISAFKEWIKREEKSTGMKLINFKTDNGREYNDVNLCCVENGIIHLKTAPYAHEQAGGAERINLTLLDKIRSLLFTAKLSNEFWAEALEAVVFIYNRTPHSSLDLITPFERRFKKPPQLKGIKIWGSIAYSKIDGAKKLSPRAKPNLLVGYSDNNQYKLFDLDTSNTFWARDIEIIEGLFITQINHPSKADYLNTELPDTDNQLLNYYEFRGDIPKTVLNSSNNPDNTPITEIETEYSHKDIPNSEINSDTSPNSGSLYQASPTTSPNSENISELNIQTNPLDDLSEDELALHTINSYPSDPLTYKKAMSSPNKDEWKKATCTEIKELTKQNVWVLVYPTPDMNILLGKWIFKTKYNKDGTINKHKARYVAKGFQQKYGIDFIETFSNTVKPMVFTALFIIAAFMDLEIIQWDIKSAFPNAPLKEKIYMHQPEGFNDGTNRVCLLQKALYGLKQAAREFYRFLAGILLELGFKPLYHDQSVFINNINNIIIAAHIDDLLVFAPKNSNFIKVLKGQIEKRVEISDLGDISYYLGIEITRNRDKREIFLNQGKYVRDLLERFNIKGDKPIITPTIQGIRLEKNPNQASPNSIKLYQQQIGSLIYLMTSTRPDIAFAVNNCARYMSNPDNTHFHALNRIWQYVRTTQTKGLKFSPNGNNKIELEGFVDSDWGGDYSTRKSTTGFIFLLGQCPISWSSKLQKSVALSSCEAEYMALNQAAKEQIWLNGVFNELKPLINYIKTDLIHCDSKSAIDLSKNPEHHARSKHIDIQYHYVRDCIEKELFKLQYIPTNDQLADALTKALDINAYKRFISRINIKDHI